MPVRIDDSPDKERKYDDATKEVEDEEKQRIPL